MNELVALFLFFFSSFPLSVVGNFRRVSGKIYVVTSCGNKELTSRSKLVLCYKNIKRVITSGNVFFGILLCLHISKYKSFFFVVVVVRQNIPLMTAITLFFFLCVYSDLT